MDFENKVLDLSMLEVFKNAHNLKNCLENCLQDVALLRLLLSIVYCLLSVFTEWRRERTRQLLGQ